MGESPLDESNTSWFDEEPLTAELVHASAVRFLIDGGEEDAANILLSCSFDMRYTHYRKSTKEQLYTFDLVGPRVAYDAFISEDSPVWGQVQRAIEAILPSGHGFRTMNIRAELIPTLDPDWHKELLEIARGRGVHNQIADTNETKLVRTWNNLRFRSASEVRIADALDRAGVFFLPNCKGRLGLLGKRENKEPDFLVCLNGKWGILEVDGEPFHPPSRTVEDHERDRLFKQHGIRVVEHYDANRCYEHPEEVVQNFLEILKQS
ncbi:MAG TPA: hypothetical protein VFV38_22140 [Ktedonobacteraceae bacterium]|nr:hypothetical protein [Ktedonobacteraceae bacterium]